MGVRGYFLMAEEEAEVVQGVMECYLKKEKWN